MIGHTIGDYRILELRGEGGMGAFYKAIDLRLEHHVGLKTLRDEFVAEGELLARLHSEAKTLAQLDHPNIARLLHYLVVDNRPFIVMEFVEGMDLSEMVKRKGLLPLPEVLRVIDQVCAAIGYAHERGVVHRDIKPSNIMMRPDGVVKVTDFGIAKTLGASARTKTGVATGSLPFMAPEQIRGDDIDARTDIYQLGITVFELTTGERPFRADNEYDLMTAHLEKPPPAASSLNSRVPRRLDAILFKAIAKAPADRFADVAEFNDALRGSLTSESQVGGVATSVSVSPTPPPSPQQAMAGRPIRADDSASVGAADTRKTTRDGGAYRGRGRRIALAGFLTIIIAVGAWWFGLRERDREPDRVAETMGIRTAVRITATLPAGVSSESVAVAELRVSQPDNELLDTVPLVGNRIERLVPLRAASAVTVSLTGTSAAGDTLFAGRETARVIDGEILTIDIPLASVAQHSSQSTATTPDDRFDAQHPSDGDTNCQIDILPFARRSEISELWIDGQPHPARLPVALLLTPGVHTVRWEIGGNRWTDTLTVKASGLSQKTLFPEAGVGRLNLTASFAGQSGYADILIDGVASDKGTPAELREIVAGPHEVTLVREGYRMVRAPEIVFVRADDRTRLRITMVAE